MKITIDGVQGEGKSTVAKSIAALLGESGHRVELYDGGVVAVGQTPEIELPHRQADLRRLPPMTVLVTVARPRAVPQDD